MDSEKREITITEEEIKKVKELFFERLKRVPFLYDDIFPKQSETLLVLPVAEKENVTAAVDGTTLYYNPKAIAYTLKYVEEVIYPKLVEKYKEKYKHLPSVETIRDFIIDFLLLHEATHIAHLHTLKGNMKAARDIVTATIENIAQDFEINIDIVDDIARRLGVPVEMAMDIVKKLFLFPDKIEDNKLIATERERISTGSFTVAWKLIRETEMGEIKEETIYPTITAEKIEPRVEILGGYGAVAGAIEKGKGTGSDFGGAPAFDKGERIGGTDVDISGGTKEKGEYIRKLKRDLREFFDTADKVAKQAGLTPAGLSIEIERLFKGVYNWRELLIDEITRNMEEISFTYAYPHQRTFTIWEVTGRREIVYPAIRYESYPNVIVVIDTSGSTVGKPVTRFFSELAELKRQMPDLRIILILHDADVQRVVDIPPGQMIDLDYIRNVIKPRGAGGTLMKPVVDYIKVKNLDMDCAALIWFTDGYFGDSKEEIKNIVDKINCRTKVFALPEMESTTEYISEACKTCKTIYLPIEEYL